FGTTSCGRAYASGSGRTPERLSNSATTMRYAAGAPAWPGEDQVAIALAAKVAMLAAASRTCAIKPSSKAQKALLDEVAKVAASKHVNGQPFPDFLVDAKE